MNKPKPKKCAVCRVKFIPVRGIQPTCLSMECQAEYGLRAAEKAQKRREKAERAKWLESRKIIRMRMQEMKPLSYWAKRAERAVNAWIRERDKDLPCISCGRHHKGQWHAGHYLTVKAHPELRYEPLNIHKQCKPCNHDLAGNLIEYRKGLLAKIGQDAVDWLEGPHDPKRYRKDDYLAIEAEFKSRLTELKLRPPASRFE